ncbi:redoxin domain-containing protein [Planomonospora sp. ID67723]|uniref:TlpA family protein disulfide reductase n=1 Tax=Planomonospora sp. ID67723 TaxID=2738134 RepID=UPI0018C374D3|nr:redoxin domain-containing protein [Planomonospora sp. ID67723]MBG0829246.1 redoxin domain-containing protein [Planomonospora sp. ID67723]
MIRSRTAAALAATALLLAAGCGTAGNDAAGPAATSPAATGSGEPSEPVATPKASVPQELAFTARTLGGQTFEGASLAGKPVVFWFWAPWCLKCRSEAPAVRSAAEKYGDVAFVGVASLDTEAAMKEFVRSTGTGTIVQLSDEKGAVWTRLGVSQQSTFVFMKPDGSTEKASGPLGSGELDGHVEKLRAG